MHIECIQESAGAHLAADCDVNILGIQGILSSFNSGHCVDRANSESFAISKETERDFSLEHY